jgi:hypothetical protein
MAARSAGGAWTDTTGGGGGAAAAGAGIGWRRERAASILEASGCAWTAGAAWGALKAGGACRRPREMSILSGGLPGGVVEATPGQKVRTSDLERLHTCRTYIEPPVRQASS